ncbi:hypothetical protein HNR30_007802 [Nonomuraea soli]|uniref:Recombinase family protein n=1 Tax=Nonomuraea soli TaxID=1032476 RepID=A0A7W0HV48_9ACTN|nr:hypothetical protein [Nonomuraea soli]
MPPALPPLDSAPPPVAAIYDRASKDSRRTQKSVTDQHDANVQTCERHGWTVGET